MKNLRKVVSIIILVAFGLTSVLPPAHASQMPWMPAPGSMVSLSPTFMPAILKGITIHPEDPLKFDFIIHRGDETLTNDQKQDIYKKLIKYFLASLAVPDENQWVNLSPYEKDRLIEEDFGKTEMGRDLLAQDYLLKQLTSSLMFPESEIGKAFWNKIYKEAKQKFGTTDIPVDTFNKVWIVPDDALIYEKGQTAYVLKHHLKVMLEEDYVALEHNALEKSQGQNVDKIKELSEASQKVLREIIIPAIEKEVNEGKNFAALRQVYSGMLLAAWYKRNLQETLLGKIYADKSKVKGVDQDDPKKNQEIYNQYVDAFRKGVYNLIKEEYDPTTKSIIPRKYFSGGAVTPGVVYNAAVKETSAPVHQQEAQGEINSSADVINLMVDRVGGNQETVQYIKSSLERAVTVGNKSSVQIRFSYNPNMTELDYRTMIEKSAGEMKMTIKSWRFSENEYAGPSAITPTASFTLSDQVMETAEQLNTLKSLMQDPEFSSEMAAWQDGAYYRGQGQEAPAFLTAEEKTQKVEKSVAEEKIAMNLAGFYALESGVGYLSERDKKSPQEIISQIANKTLVEEDMLLLARFANATWKAGQPFRSLSRITRDAFIPAVMLSDAELKKDFDQLYAAAEKLSESFEGVEIKNIQEQLDILKSNMQDPVYAEAMAGWLDGAYYRGQGQEAPAFLTVEEKTQKVEKSVAEEKIAMNLAGFYALESGVGYLSERDKKSPQEIISQIANKTLVEEDMLLLARFANATWKAGQPFRSLSRITRDAFIPAVMLSDAELKKDFDQLYAAAEKLSESFIDSTTAGDQAMMTAEDLEKIRKRVSEIIAEGERGLPFYYNVSYGVGSVYAEARNTTEGLAKFLKETIRAFNFYVKDYDERRISPAERSSQLRKQTETAAQKLEVIQKIMDSMDSKAKDLDSMLYELPNDPASFVPKTTASVENSFQQEGVSMNDMPGNLPKILKEDMIGKPVTITAGFVTLPVGPSTVPILETIKGRLDYVRSTGVQNGKLSRIRLYLKEATINGKPTSDGEYYFDVAVEEKYSNYRNIDISIDQAMVGEQKQGDQAMMTEQQIEKIAKDLLDFAKQNNMSNIYKIYNGLSFPDLEAVYDKVINLGKQSGVGEQVVSELQERHGRLWNDKYREWAWPQITREMVQQRLEYYDTPASSYFIPKLLTRVGKNEWNFSPERIEELKEIIVKTAMTTEVGLANVIIEEIGKLRLKDATFDRLHSISDAIREVEKNSSFGLSEFSYLTALNHLRSYNNRQKVSSQAAGINNEAMTASDQAMMARAQKALTPEDMKALLDRRENFPVLEELLTLNGVKKDKIKALKNLLDLSVEGVGILNDPIKIEGWKKRDYKKLKNSVLAVNGLLLTLKNKNNKSLWPAIAKISAFVISMNLPGIVFNPEASPEAQITAGILYAGAAVVAMFGAYQLEVRIANSKQTFQLEEKDMLGLASFVSESLAGKEYSVPKAKKSGYDFLNQEEKGKEKASALALFVDDLERRFTPLLEQYLIEKNMITNDLKENFRIQPVSRKDVLWLALQFFRLEEISRPTTTPAGGKILYTTARYRVAPNKADKAMVIAKDLKAMLKLNPSDQGLFLHQLRYTAGRPTAEGFVRAKLIEGLLYFFQEMLVENKNPNIFRDLQAKGVSKETMKELSPLLDLFKPLKLSRKSLGDVFPKSLPYSGRIKLANNFAKQYESFIIKASTMEEAHGQLVNEITKWKGIAGLSEYGRRQAAEAIAPLVGLQEIKQGDFEVQLLNYSSGEADLNAFFDTAFSDQAMVTLNNGFTVDSSMDFTIKSAVKDLRNLTTLPLLAVYRKAKDPEGYNIDFDDKKLLEGTGLVDKDGKMDDLTRNIILSAVKTGRNGTIIVNPIMSESVDQAMLGQKDTPVGGIDFNAANLNMQIKRDGNGMVLPLEQQDLENIRIDGLVPIILDIKPAVGILNLI